MVIGNIFVVVVVVATVPNFNVVFFAGIDHDDSLPFDLSLSFGIIVIAIAIEGRGVMVWHRMSLAEI